jgi:beta-galactosidase
MTRLNQLIYGGCYSPEQWPESVWREDVDLMRRAGVNCLAIGTSAWPWLQPVPGTIDFDLLDRAISLFHENEIALILATGTASPPAWLFHAHPDAVPVHGPRQHPCPNSGDYRQHANELVRQLTARYGRHPALVAWMIDHGFDQAPAPCVCPRCGRQFRRWLQSRHGTLENLASHWGRSIGDWEEILAPQAAPALACPAQQLDFHRFTSDAVLGGLLAEKEILRAATPDIPVTTNFALDHGFSRGLDAWAFARQVDFITLDLVADPHHTAPSDLAMQLDLHRGLANGRPWLVRQPPCHGRGTAKRPGQLRLLTCQALAHGADGALFSEWRAPVSGPGKFRSALVPHGGPALRLHGEAAQLGGELRTLAAIRGTVTPAEVAVVVDWESLWALDLESRPARLDYTEILRACYHALVEPDMAVDFIAADADISRYKLVVAPGLHLVRPGMAENFEAFVNRGGTFVTTFFSGMVDGSDRVFQGGHPAPFRRLLGIQVEEFDPVPHGQVRHLRTAQRAAKCSLWADTIALESAEVVATFTEGFQSHRPAITRNAVGRGLAYYVGTLPEPAFLRPFFAELCADSGVREPLRAPAGVEAVTRSGAAGEFLFLLNHDAVIHSVDIGPRPRQDLLTGETVEGQCSVLPCGVRVLVPVTA